MGQERISKILKMDKTSDTISWDKVGILFAIISLGFGLYFGYHEKKPAITYSIINCTNVVDVHKNVNNLVISFEGEDIQRKNMDLTIINLKVESDGDIDILQNYYDVDTDWGFEIINGKIIEPRLISSNTNYLIDHLKPNMKDNKVSFNKVIFEKNKYFLMDILILHEKDLDPQIRPIGKVAGIDSIKVITVPEKDKQSFAQRFLSADLLTHSVRLFFYLALIIIFIFVLIGLSILWSSISERITKSKRNKGIKVFLLTLDDKESKIIQPVIDLYINFGPWLIAELQEIFENGTLYNHKEKNRRLHDLPPEMIPRMYERHPRGRAIHILNKLELVSVDGEKITTDATFLAAFNKLFDFIKEKDNLKQEHYRIYDEDMHYVD